MEKNNALWVVYEGIGCSGKSTQIKLTEEHLLQQGIQVLRTREPGGDPGSEEIRQMIFELGRKKLSSADDEFVLFFASRRLFTINVVFKNLDEGKAVISDRWASSTKVYQGYAGGVDQDKIDAWTRCVSEHNKRGLIYPDAVILLDINLSTYKNRMCNRGTDGDPFDEADEGYTNKLINGYKKLARNNWPNNTKWYSIDGNSPQNEVWEQVKSTVNKIWKI